MSEFRRFAIYHMPEEPALAAFGASWLGWDLAAGADAVRPRVPGLDLADITATPRKYGFHGTMKPPFRLADGESAGTLAAAVSDLAATLSPVRLDGLRLATLGGFLALVPDGATAALDALAFRLVAGLDGFRAPARPEEIARRRAAGLSPRQEALLLRWGYPYVEAEFRFHLTLSGKLAPPALEAARAAAERLLPPLPRPCEIASIALVGERPDGMFERVRHYALTG